jgi:UDP-3-O-[3-hydroxymyristoyl] glucosamine N-acyltransferase
MSAKTEINLQQLAALVGGQLAFTGAHSVWIRGVASVDDAGPEDVTFLGNPKYLAGLRASRAAAALVPEDFSEEVPPVLIRTANPSLAFAKLVEYFTPTPVEFAPGIHPKAFVSAGAEVSHEASVQPFAVVEEGASVGAGTTVGAHGYVGRGARIGRNCFLHPRVTVAHGCVLGDRVVLHSGVVVGSDGFGFENQAGRHVKIPQVGIVQIDDDVEIGANTSLDRARFGRTWIKAGTKIDNLVQIAHNVVVGENCLIVAQTGISGSTRLGDSVTLAGQVGVVGHIEIASGVVVSAQSGVSKTLRVPGLYMGSPALPAVEYREQVAHLRRLEKLADRVRSLERKVTTGAAD